jgi:hypothetical protein
MMTNDQKQPNPTTCRFCGAPKKPHQFCCRDCVKQYPPYEPANDETPMKNAPYFDQWWRRYKPLENDGYWCLAAYFSRQFFLKLKEELIANGYELTAVDRRSDEWLSPPVGCFFVTDDLEGESFAFQDFAHMEFKKPPPDTTPE